MKGFVVDDPAYVGRFRDESGVAGYEVRPPPRKKKP
jgi:hypothetical protein